MFGGRRRTGFAAGTPSPAKAPDNALIECLGVDAFAKLPEVVQRAHHGTMQLSGKARVERGRGLGGLVAALLRLPSSNPAADLVVTAWHFPDQMIWSRSFDGSTFESTFLKEGDLLVEHIGPFALALRPTAEAARLVYRLDSCRLGPIPWPRALAPSLNAWEGEKEGKYVFEVSVGLPLFGPVIKYSGTLELQVLAT